MGQFIVQVEKPRGSNFHCLCWIDWLCGCGLPKPWAQVLDDDISGPRNQSGSRTVRGCCFTVTDALPVDSAALRQLT